MQLVPDFRKTESCTSLLPGRAFTLSDAAHKAATALAVAVGALKVEDLNAKGRQSKTGKAAVGAFLRILEYKAE